MTFQLDVRMGLFPIKVHELVHAPGNSFDAATELGVAFNLAQFLASVHWSAGSGLGLQGRPLGLPVQPYVVQTGQAPKISEVETDVGDRSLTSSNGAHFNNYVPPAVDGLFYLRAEVVTADPDVAIYATDLDHDEIASSRQTPQPGVAVIFHGPGLYGLRATGNVKLGKIHVGVLPSNLDVPWQTAAEVAPCIDGVPAYALQSYLGHNNVPPLEALRLRLLADALGRANTPPPANLVLEDMIHRADPSFIVQELLATPLFENIRDHFADIVADPNWSFTQPLQIPDGPTIDGEFWPVPLLQWMAVTGPVEATTVGHGVSVPLPNQMTGATPADLLQLFSDTSKPLPIPLIRVIGFFPPLPSSSAEPRVIIRLARLVWPAGDRTATAEALEPTRRAPKARDEPAHTDVRVRVAEPPRMETVFVARGIGVTETPEVLFYEHVKRPKGFFAAADPLLESQTQLIDTDVPLPLIDPVVPAKYVLYPRDEFGRWPKQFDATCNLEAWRVSPPVFISTEVSYGPNDAIHLKLMLAWNWGLRTPKEIEIGLKVGDQDDDSILVNLQPSDGVTAPWLGANVSLGLTFAADEKPEVQFPTGAAHRPSVTQLPPFKPEPGEELDLSDPGRLDERRYLLTIPLSDSAGLFVGRGVCVAASVGRAREAVSGNRWSEPSRKLHQSIYDPRPPQIARQPWQLLWSSRPNPAAEARVCLSRPQLSSGTVSGFNVWRTNEASLVDLILTEQPGWEQQVALVLKEEDMELRLLLLQGLTNQLDVGVPDFREKFSMLFESASLQLHAKDPIELTLPGRQTGLELFMFTASSTNGVTSSKLDYSGIFAAAVPKGRHLSRPAIRVLSVDDTGILEGIGACLLIVSSQDEFKAGWARVFWDSGVSIETEDSLFQSPAAYLEIDQKKAGKYIADIDAIVARHPFKHHRIFFAQPSPSWQTHYFSADIKNPASAGPADDVPSSRAPLARCSIAPVTKPKLLQKSYAFSPKGHDWRVSYENLPESASSDFDRSQVYAEYIDGGVSTFPKQTQPMTLLDLASKQLEINLPAGQISIERLGREIAVNKSFTAEGDRLKLMATDPVRREATIELTTPP